MIPKRFERLTHALEETRIKFFNALKTSFLRFKIRYFVKSFSSARQTTGNYTYNLYRKGTALFDAVKFSFNVIKHAFSSFSFARPFRKLLLEL